jgi:PPOX class probable F420-dependent enzyme
MESFEHFRRADTVLLTTRRRDGRTIDTPVNVAVDAEGRGYFRTDAGSGKAKRLANFPGVRLAPCTRRGRPQGSDQPAVATRLGAAEAGVAAELLAKRFPVQGRLVPLADRLRRREVAYYRLDPADEPTPWTGTPTP